MTQLSPRAPTDLGVPIRALNRVNRILTWGMAPDDRRRLLDETMADWEAMAEYESTLALVGRGLRGIPAWVWMRLQQRETTAVPAALAMTSIAVCGFVMSTDTSSYPLNFRFWAAVAAAGFIWLATTLLRNPRIISLHSLRLPSVISAVSVMTMAVSIPTPTEWPYAAPMLRSVLTEGALRAGVFTVGLALGVLWAGSFTHHERRLFRTAGVLFVLGILQVAVSQIVWGIWAIAVDVMLGGASIGVGLAALAMAHLMPRLRHLEIERGGSE